MKLIILFILLGTSLNVASQKQSVFDTSFLNTSSKDFFKNNPVIDSIVVHHTNYLVYLKTRWENIASSKFRQSSYDSYSSNFLGDIYLFEKKYGKLLLPEKALAILASKDCSNMCHLKVVLNADSIKCQRSCTCPSANPPTDDYEMVFTKTEIFARIKNGTNQLQKRIHDAFKELQNGMEFASSDSVLIYKVLVDRKDSCLQSIELIEGHFCHFEQMVMDVLQHTCLWLPAEQGGRAVSYITKVFIRLNKDGNITVDVVK